MPLQARRRFPAGRARFLLGVAPHAGTSLSRREHCVPHPWRTLGVTSNEAADQVVDCRVSSAAVQRDASAARRTGLGTAASAVQSFAVASAAAPGAACRRQCGLSKPGRARGVGRSGRNRIVCENRARSGSGRAIRRGREPLRHSAKCARAVREHTRDADCASSRWASGQPGGETDGRTGTRRVLRFSPTPRRPDGAACCGACDEKPV
jgi:hypothetical protein